MTKQELIDKYEIEVELGSWVRRNKKNEHIRF